MGFIDMGNRCLHCQSKWNSIHNVVCDPLVALFTWQRPQILLLWLHTAVFRLTDMGVYQCLICFRILCGSMGNMYLMWSYIWQEVRKCSSVSTILFVGTQLVFSQDQSLLWQPLSVARLCSLSLYIVKVFINFGSVTVVEYSATVYSLFRDR